LTILGRNEEALIELFASQTDVDYSNNAVNGISYKAGQTGAPILNCGVATLECTLVDALTTSGDHLLFVGKVENAIINNDMEPIHEKDTRKAYEGVSASS
jgi:flavin reductase (DIM6/NTAB) family NADH-FMN oxidoreductase RutF